MYYYKCENCGCVFEESQIDCWTEHHDEYYSERMSGCPNCGSGISDDDEATECHGCGEVFRMDDMVGGFCGECLKKEITYEFAREYFIHDDILMGFFLYYCGCEYENVDITQGLMDELQQWFDNKVQTDKESGTTHFLNKVQEYALEDMTELENYMNRKEQQ